MGSESPVIDREEVQNALCQIAEIEAVRVVGDHDDLIQELHVLASGPKTPRQIVSDIESLLMARFGIAIDQKKISIAQINSAPENALPKKRTPGRLKIVNITIGIKEHEANIEVSLEHGSFRYSGTAKGTTSQSSRLRLAAIATLDAATKFVNPDTSLTLEHISILPISSGEVAVACVSVVKRAGEKVYAGSAMVKNDECDSVVKATLSAINRYLLQ